MYILGTAPPVKITYLCARAVQQGGKTKQNRTKPKPTKNSLNSLSIETNLPAVTGDKLPALSHLETEDNCVPLTKHIFIVQSSHACISRFSESLQMCFKNHCQANSLKGIFLTQGNVLLYHTKCILD